MDKTTATLIVNKIIKDLSDRSGLGNEWEQLDDDIQQEIRDTWVEIVMKTKS